LESDRVEIRRFDEHWIDVVWFFAEDCVSNRCWCAEWPVTYLIAEKPMSRMSYWAGNWSCNEPMLESAVKCYLQVASLVQDVSKPC